MNSIRLFIHEKKEIIVQPQKCRGHKETPPLKYINLIMSQRQSCSFISVSFASYCNLFLLILEDFCRQHHLYFNIISFLYVNFNLLYQPYLKVYWCFGIALIASLNRAHLCLWNKWSKLGLVLCFSQSLTTYSLAIMYCTKFSGIHGIIAAVILTMHTWF